MELCIRRIPSNTWYRILPNSSFECEDLSFAIRQSWDTISPLLTKLGYIKNYGKECRINQIKFENLQHVIPGIDQCHTSFHHPKGGCRQLFICVGKPQYSGPTKQINATKDKKFAHKRYMKKADRDLKLKLQVFNDSEKDGIITLDNVQESNATPEAQIPAATPPINNMFEDDILSALSLDLLEYPRPSRLDPSTNIILNSSKVCPQSVKLIILLIANKWGLHDNKNTYSDRMRVARAASRLVAYDNGFCSEFSTCSILRWSADVNKKIQEDASSTLIASNLYKKRISDVEKIENMNPGYLHFLYRHAI